MNFSEGKSVKTAHKRCDKSVSSTDSFLVRRNRTKLQKTYSFPNVIVYNVSQKDIFKCIKPLKYLY